MRPLLRASVRANARRWGPLAVVIALSVAFFTVSFGVGDLIVSSGVVKSAEETRGADTVVSGHMTDEAAAALEKKAAAAGGQALVLRSEQLTLQTEKADRTVTAAEARPEAFGRQSVSSGRLPEGPREIALDEDSLSALGLRVGDSVQAHVADPSADGREGPEPAPRSLRVVGSTASEGVFGTGVVAEGSVPASQPLWPSTLVLVRGAGLGEADVPAGLTAESRSDYLDAQRASQKGRSSTLPFLLFAVIALLVAVMVIATSMSVLTARRTRELALLRLVGATQGASVRALLAEAVLLGAVSGSVGVLLGLGAVRLVPLAVPPLAGVPFEPTAVTVLAPWAIGIGAAVLGALPAARLVRRVRPLQAVTADESSVTAPLGRTRFPAVSTAVFALSTAAMVFFSLRHSLVFGLLLGVLSAVALLVAFRGVAARLAALVPAAVRRSPSARMARGNIVANPSRSASTAAALLIGVTLVTMLFTGVSTARSTTMAGLAHDEPFDLAVSVRSARPDALARVRAIDGVQSAGWLLPVWERPTGQGNATAGDGAGRPADPQGSVLYALPAGDPGQVARGDIAGLEDNRVYGVSSVSGTGRDLPTTIGSGPSAVRLGEPVTVSNTRLLVVNHRTGERISAAAGRPAAAQPVLAIRLKDSVQDDEVDAIRAKTATALGVPRVAVDGGFALRTTMEKGISVLVTVALALLGMSILIALIGVSNTLGMSQRERTRESSLLRALGMRRSGVARIVTWESLGLTAAALAVALPLGVVYGWAGAEAAIPAARSAGPSAPVLDWGALGATVGLAFAVALLASLVPAARAGRVTPTQGLAAA
ncbi:FtsX-like permease family protein [Arthrobacter sp. UM1]|uniref:FtsX-like permease family protein n=1 Tax=Arthrobacter sp. UM1 TaxID=2766776 RepID=UPI001CF6CC91|nr:ABC transporter permease [Arthrobacter sp. UM1]MCB4207285.1 ABC transporter permease [Arthrobacter sp. UM1]